MPPRATVRAILDHCSSAPGTHVALRTVELLSGRTVFEARGELAGLTMIVKRHFERSNWPFKMDWAAGGEQQAYYTMTPSQAEGWLATAADDAPFQPGAAQPLGSALLDGVLPVDGPK